MNSPCTCEKDILALRLFEDNWRTDSSGLQHHGDPRGLLYGHSDTVFINSVEPYWIATTNKYFNAGGVTFRSRCLPPIWNLNLVLSVSWNLKHSDGQTDFDYDSILCTVCEKRMRWGFIDVWRVSLSVHCWRKSSGSWSKQLLETTNAWCQVVATISGGVKKLS
jgi:hypothetical protein